jgi:RNA polymerase sigma factor (sigma-70 family)
MNLPFLLNECRRHNLPAQRYIYDHYARRMFLTCRRYVRPDVVAEELMMNGFLKFFNSLDKFEYVSDTATGNWIISIMVSECLMHLREQKNFLLIASSELPDVEADEDLVSGLSAKEIFTLITQLPVGYRTIFNLYVIEQMSHTEIASALGIDEGTSRSQLKKARHMLQQMIIKNDKDYESRKTK